MGKIYFNSGEKFCIVSNSHSTVNGTGANGERAIINTGAKNINISSTIEKVDLPGNIADFRFKQGFGSAIQILDAADNIIANVSDINGKQFSFQDGTVDITYTSGAVELGGVSISTTASSVVPIAINNTVTSISDTFVNNTTGVKIYLESTDSMHYVTNSHSMVSGTGAAGENLVINTGVIDVTVTSTIEKVDFAGSIADFRFKQGFGSAVQIQDAVGNVIANVSDLNGKKFSFSDGTIDLSYSEGVASLGGKTISTTASTVVPVTINQLEKSAAVESIAIAISGDGTTIASDTDIEQFNIASTSTYTATIVDFDTKVDKLNFGSNISANDISIINTVSDGSATLNYTPDSGSTVVTITLTNLTAKEDIALTTNTGVSAILLGGLSTIDSQTIALTSDTTGVVGVAENFTYTIDSSSGSTVSGLNSDITLSGFIEGEDSLTFTDVSNGTVTTATFLNEVIVSPSNINNLTDIIFEANSSGVTHQLTLVGIVDSTLSTVDMVVE